MAREIYVIRYESKMGNIFESGIFPNYYLDREKAQKSMFNHFDEIGMSWDVNGIEHSEITCSDMCGAATKSGDYYKIYLEGLKINDDES